MDAHQVPLLRVTSCGVLLLSVALSAVGCRSRREMVRDGVKTQVRRELRKAKKNPSLSTLRVTGDRNSFAVMDEQGRPLLEARVERIDGAVRPDQGIQGPVMMRRAKCRLYQQGKPQLDLEAPEATWDGERLVAGKTAHGKTADGKMVLDAKTAAWTATGGLLALEGARLDSLEKGKPTFTAEAARAEVAGTVITMPAGAVGRNPEGQQLRADRVRWYRDTGKLEATGNVVVSDRETRVSGERLQADTRLKKGRFSGGTRIHARAGRLPLAQNRNR